MSSFSRETHCNQHDEISIDFEEIKRNEKRMLWVLILTLTTMLVEIVAGYLYGSMALLADGYHMASHAGALGIAYLVYQLARSEKIKSRLNFGTGKLLSLGGYTSALGLGMIAVWMIIESVQRLFEPHTIHYGEAIAVATLGLAVNVVSALILGLGHDHHHHGHSHGDHDHEHRRNHIEDHNHKSALVHVITDALTSVLAIFALVCGAFFDAAWLDPVMGLVGAAVILRWAYGLCRDTAWELLDERVSEVETEQIKAQIEASGGRVIDFHLWKIGPGNHACQLMVEAVEIRGSHYYRQFLPPEIAASVHLVVEERSLSAHALSRTPS